MHNSTIVPIEPWAFANPKIRALGRNCDIGIFAEALIFYDIVYLIPSSPSCFNELIRWLITQNAFDDFLGLMRDGIIKIYDYEFLSTAVQKDGVYSIWNVQGQDQIGGNVFEQRYLYNTDIERLLPAKGRRRSKVYNSFRGNVIEVKAEAFGASIDNARHDFQNCELNDLTIQAFIDEVYAYSKHGIPPKIKTSIEKKTSDDFNIHWNIDINELSKIAGSRVNFNPGDPLTAYAQSNRFLWSAAATGFDLYLPEPMSKIVGNKMYEACYRNNRIETSIKNLKAEVDFPDIQEYVNLGKLGFNDIVVIRNKARNFREWIQKESDKEHDTVIAYYNDILKDSSYAKLGRKTISIFGVLGGGAIGGGVGSLIAGPVGGVVGGVASSGITFVVDMITKLNEGWKPVVFGNWLKDDIERIIKKEETPNNRFHHDNPA